MKIKSNSFAKMSIYLVVLALSFGAIFLRFFKLATQPYWMDEGYTVNAVLSVIEKGKTILDSGQYYSCASYCYPTAWFAKIFGQANPASYRALAALAGIAFIVAIFFIVKKWLGTKVAILATFFIAFSYWQIAWSREARWYTLLELFFWLAIYFFWQTIKMKNKLRHSAIYLTLTVICTAIAIATHKEALLLIPLFLIWYLVDLIIRQLKRKDFIFNLKSLVPILGVFIIMAGSAIAINKIAPIAFHYSLPYYLSFYLRNYWLFIIPMIWLFFSTKDKNKLSTSYFLLYILLAYFVTFGFFTDLVHYRYLFLITPALYILGASGIINLSERIKHNLWRAVFFWLIIIIFFASGHGVLWPKNFYFLESDDPSKINNRPYYAYTPQSNFKEAYNYVKEKKSSQELIISSQPVFNKIYLQEPGYWLEYRYLGINDKNSYISTDNREYYVGAEVIANLDNLKRITKSTHGYIVFDYYSTQDRIPEEEITFISQNFQLVFQSETNSYSKIWVYKF